MSDGTGLPIDQDDTATWPQLRDRLREIRAAAEVRDEDNHTPVGWLLAILDRPRETA